MDNYSVAGTHVAHQNIDGEVIVVDLVNGIYFSITGSGSIIWQHLVNGYSVDQIVNHMLLTHDASRKEIETAVEKLVQQLVTESLLVQRKEDAVPAPLPVPSDNFVKEAFQPVTFEKYTDMDAALMLDPIHDTDESGWPCQPAGAVESPTTK
jgi:hypothetical protein